MRVLIIGAGGHAQVVADILLRMRERNSVVNPIGYLDDDDTLQNQELLGLPVLGKVADFRLIEHDAIIIAFGSNRLRHQLHARLLRQGEHFFTATHPSAIVAQMTTIGEGTMICAGAIVGTGSTIGRNVILNTACSVDHHNQIGDYAHLAPGTHLGGQVQIGQGTLVGIGATVLPRQIIGEWSIVGAGAVVTRNIPDRVTVAGIPARIHESRTS
ncbi:UDP-perosamine 4-acetyltransferase [Anaerolineae bacterium]|nr:UDP-perosamine 4-acetyltransferase [Anaerolineae bacterium]